MVNPGGSSGSFTVTIAPSASASATAGPSGTNPDGTSFVGTGTCSASVGPITVSTTTPAIAATGTYNPAKGDYRVLTGQQITRALSGTLGTVTSYTWKQPSATCFKTYNPNIQPPANNQLVQLASTDLSGTDTSGKGINVSPLAFYDSAGENLTLTCAVTLTAPDGKTVLNVSASSPQITVEKPTASWGIDPKSVPINGTSTPNVVGFVDSSAGSQYFGANTTWYPATLSVPAPFASLGGLGCFAQISTPSATITRTPTGTGASSYSIKIQNAQGAWVTPGTGLDKGFPYPIGFTTDANGNWTGQASDSSWSVSGIGASGDYPKGQETVPDVDSGGSQWTSSSISYSFTTWLMYKPNGGVWIPIQSATWSVSGNASGGPSNWSATGSYTAPSPSNTTNFPQWITVISGQQYRP